jgi:hypothetical protein
VFTPYIRDDVAVADLADEDGGTAIHWHSTFFPRLPGSAWFARRVLTGFVQRCADGLADVAARQAVRQAARQAVRGDAGTRPVPVEPPPADTR